MLVREKAPEFSGGELARRREALLAAAAEQGCDLVVAYGADRSGSAVPWPCDWPVTREAVLLVDARSGEDLLLVQFHNHVGQATALARGCEVRWGGASTADTLVAELARRDAGRRRVGVVGPVGYGLHGPAGEARPWFSEVSCPAGARAWSGGRTA